MRYALVQNIREEAAPKIVGICPHCGSPVIAKCGQIKINHWAHKNGKKPDCKWEPETQWHRDWKNEFPSDCQEYSQRDKYGELHIADVFTPQGLALEFQHSSIEREEIEARTNFYGNICWVVDGLRLKTSWKKFQKAIWIGYERCSENTVVHKVFAQDSPLLKQWSGLYALVIFDFGDNGLWVIDHSDGHSAYTHQIRRGSLIQQLKLGKRPPPVQPYNANSHRLF